MHDHEDDHRLDEPERDDEEQRWRDRAAAFGIPVFTAAVTGPSRPRSSPSPRR
jgi:hypothetical protein